MATKNSRGRPKASLERDLRSLLVKTSLELLNEGGPAALSMREVARRAGCTHQAPYHYFEDRESILAALVRDGFDTLAKCLQSANDIASTEGIRPTVIASAKAYVGFALANSGIFRIMFRPDMCNPSRFPEVVEAGIRARSELDRLNLIVHGESANPIHSAMLWAHVHGLSCLLLDGPLAENFKSPRQLKAFVNAVAVEFAGRLLD
jgi:AcrR family transcriptional regulator